MWSYYDYVTAGMKVVYDKTSDYALYYSGWGDYEKDKEESNNNDDVIQIFFLILIVIFYIRQYFILFCFVFFLH